MRGVGGYGFHTLVGDLERCTAVPRFELSMDEFDPGIRAMG